MYRVETFFLKYLHFLVFCIRSCWVVFTKWKSRSSDRRTAVEILHWAYLSQKFGAVPMWIILSSVPVEPCSLVGPYGKYWLPLLQQQYCDDYDKWARWKTTGMCSLSQQVFESIFAKFVICKLEKVPFYSEHFLPFVGLAKLRFRDTICKHNQFGPRNIAKSELYFTVSPWIWV